MGPRQALSPRIREAVRDFRRSAGIERAIVFGSHAAGTATAESDVDLLLVDARFEGIKSFKRAVGLRKYWPLDLPVDILCYTPREFQALRLRPTVVREAAEHGVEA